MGVIGVSGTLTTWAQEYGRRLQKALPPGRFYAFAHDSAEQGLLTALGTEFARVRAMAESAFDAMHPGRAVDLALAAWELALGLPECDDASTVTADRQEAAWAKFRARKGGQTPAYYIALLDERFGISPVTITEYTHYTCEDDCDDFVYGSEWDNTWALVMPVTDEVIFDCESDCEDFLRTWGHHEMECLLLSLKPSHTTLLFVYTE